MDFKFDLVSSMTDAELYMEMDLYVMWRKIYIEPYVITAKGSWLFPAEIISTIPKDINLIYKVYQKYIKYVLFEMQKRKYPLKTYHYIYSDPIPKRYRIARYGRRLEKIPWNDAEDDKEDLKLLSCEEFKLLCKNGTLTDFNCKAYYAIKRGKDLYTVYDLYCFPSAFKLNVERKDFYYITYCFT